MLSEPVFYADGSERAVPGGLTRVESRELDACGISLLVKRDDLLHPLTGGNKWRKLKHNLEAFRASGRRVMATFGGAWSNHIAAVAHAGRHFGFATAAVVRGERPRDLSITLRRAMDQGMELFFVSREKYRDKDRAMDEVFTVYPRDEVFVVPEGGANRDGIRGCREIVGEIDSEFSVLCCPCGTGATLAGLAAATDKKSLGFAVLRHRGLDREVALMSSDGVSESLPVHVTINHDFHFGGYAKSSPALDRFTGSFSRTTGIPVEPVYTGKMFYGIMSLARKGYFEKGAVIVAIHTGGLQYLPGPGQGH